MEGIFQKVNFTDPRVRINTDVDALKFCLFQLDDCDKIALEIIIPRKDGSKLEIEFERLLPDWLLNKVKLDWTLREALELVQEGDKRDLIEYLLCKAADEFEKDFLLEIGIDRGVYFSVKFADQKISVWDRMLSEASLEGFVELDKEE